MKPYGVMKRAKDWVGLEVITKRDIQNGYCILPAGSRCKVTRAFSGLHLTGPPCGKCGVRVFFSSVGYHAVDPAPVDPPKKGTP